MNLAAIEMSDGMFLGYIGALAVSGVIMLLLAITGFGAQSALVRVLNALFGAGFLGYGIYLFVTEPAEFRVFYYAFILPILMIISAFTGRRSREEAAQPAATQDG